MIKSQFIVLKILIFACGLYYSDVHAAKQVLYQSEDITSIVELFKSQTRVVQRPFYIYHWGVSAELRNSKAAQENASAAGLKLLRATKQGFLDGLTQPRRNDSNMMGPGLYMAVDPIQTRSYGPGENWSLLEIRLPLGFRMLEATTSSNGGSTSSHNRAIEDLKKFSCPEVDSSYDGSGEFFRQLLAYGDIDSKCADLIRYVFSDVLKIDGFMYVYGVTNFSQCRGSDGLDLDSRRTAFVITSDRWVYLPGAEVQVYGSNTKDKREQRISIESLSYIANQKLYDDLFVNKDYLQYTEGLGQDYLLEIARARLPPEARYPYVSQMDRFRCGAGSHCVSVEIGFDDSLKNPQTKTFVFGAQDLPNLKEIAYPATITSTNPPLIEKELRWKDLEGIATLKKPEEWMRKNLFNCGSEDFLGEFGDF